MKTISAAVSLQPLSYVCRLFSPPFQLSLHTRFSLNRSPRRPPRRASPGPCAPRRCRSADPRWPRARPGTQRRRGGASRGRRARSRGELSRGAVRLFFFFCGGVLLSVRKARVHGRESGVGVVAERAFGGGRRNPVRSFFFESCLLSSLALLFSPPILPLRLSYQRHHEPLAPLEESRPGKRRGVGRGQRGEAGQEIDDALHFPSRPSRVESSERE